MFTARDSVKAGLPLVTIGAVTVHIQSKDIVSTSRLRFYCQLSDLFAYSVCFTEYIRAMRKLTNYVYRRI